MEECTKKIGAEMSADPAVFTPVRLQCSLKRNRGGGGGRDPPGRNQHLRHADNEPATGTRQQRQQGEAMLPPVAAATLSLRGEMVVPAIGVRLTPIAAPALLHTALYQSLLTRGAETKLQSG